MRIIFIFIVCFASNLCVVAQDKMDVVLSGKITDKETGQVLKDVNVYIENNEKYHCLSNRYGKYVISYRIDNKSDITLVFRHAGYDIQKKQVKYALLQQKNNDTLKINIELIFSTTLLKAVEISAEPDTVFYNPEISVADYEFLDNNFILLTYDKRLNKSSKIIYANQQNTILNSYTVPDIAKELSKDYAGNIYVICEKNVYQIEVRNNIISLYPIKKDFFEDRIKPWVDTLNQQAFYSSFVWYYPAFDYYVYNRDDTSFKKIKHIIDKPLMELYRAQYKYVDGRDKLEAYRAQLKTGIDKEIWIAIWSGFPNSIYYKPLYAPMFIQKDTILIFDHYQNKIFRYNQSCEPIDSIDISYHNGIDKKEWKTLLIKDDETQTIYSVFLRGGRYYLKELNTSNGEVIGVYKLTHKYPEKLKIKGNYAYYVYRPFESLQKKFLYKEKIK
jgi:hypothetical protein